MDVSTYLAADHTRDTEAAELREAWAAHMGPPSGPENRAERRKREATERREARQERLYRRQLGRLKRKKSGYKICTCPECAGRRQADDAVKRLLDTCARGV